MKKIFFTTFLMLLLVSKTYSQQETLITQFNYQMSLINPAVTMSKDDKIIL